MKDLIENFQVIEALRNGKKLSEKINNSSCVIGEHAKTHIITLKIT
jgi:hypothetical protein